MSRFILSIALVAALVVASQAQAQFYSTQFAPGEWEAAVAQFMDWRTGSTWNGSAADKNPGYAEGSTFEVLLSLYKDGTLGSTNGTVQQWSSNPEGWSFRHEGSDWWVTIDGGAYARQGLPTPYVTDLGIALTGSTGSNGLIVFGASGHRANISLNIPGTGTYTLAAALSSLAGTMGITIDFRTFLNGAPDNRSSSLVSGINNANDKQITFVWSSMITDMLGGGGDVGNVYSNGDVALQFNNALRNQNGVAFVAVFAPQVAGGQVPEPATIALMGLGLAGLGLARRRMTK